MIASVIHRPCRTTRRICRGCRAPLAWAISGAVALATPMANIMPEWNRAAASVAAASDGGAQPAQHQYLGGVDQDLGELRQDERERQGEHRPEFARESGS